MKKLVTEVGRFLRKLRVDADEVLFDMSQKMGCSSAFISSLELGKRPVPSDFQQKLIQIYNLTVEQQNDFQRAIDQSTSNITIELGDLNESSREVALVFARRLKTMEEKDSAKLLKWLQGSDEKEKRKK